MRILCIVLLLAQAACTVQEATPFGKHPVLRTWHAACSDAGLAPLTNSGQRIRLRGFSVMPPTGPHWCVGASDTVVVFIRNQFDDRKFQTPPSEEEILHTFMAMAYFAEVDGPRPSDGPALRAFVEQWLRNGGFSRRQSSGKTKISTKPAMDPAAARFSVVQSMVVVDTSLGATCVRYSSVTEERDDPQAQGSMHVFLEPENYACLHPKSPNELIMIGYSERYGTNRRPGPTLIRSLRPELEPFLRDIRFDAPG